MSGALSAEDRETQIPGAEKRPPGTDDSRSRREAVLGAVDLYGPLAIALYFIATTRWGAFVIPGPPFIGDIALGVVIAERGLRIARQGPMAFGLRAPALTLMWLLLGYSVITLLSEEWSLTALRDFAPYGYLVLALLAPRTHVIPQVRVASFLYVALMVNLVAVALARLTAADEWIAFDPTRDDPVFLFSERPDIAGAILGVTVAVTLARVWRDQSIVLNSIAGVGAWALLITSYSRAGFLAGCLVIAFTVARAVRYRNFAGAPSPRTVLATVGVLAAVPFVTVGVGSSLDPVDRIAGAVRGVLASGDDDSGSNQANGDQEDSPPATPDPPGTPRPVGPNVEGYGTLQARLNGWEQLSTWMIDGGPDRVSIGVGFGPHYWQLSGADHEFQGAEPIETNRFAHNFLLNTWARLGIIGVLLLVALIAYTLVVAVINLLARPNAMEATQIASMLVIAITVVSSVGVVFETPFGALPFYWAMGYLLARPELTEPKPAGG